MKSLKNSIQLLVIALNGAFIGAMVLIAVVLVPFWQTLKPQAFLDWFTAYGSTIGSIMIPFGPGVLLLAILAFFLDKEYRLLWGLTTLFTLANILYFPFFFLPTNNSFSEQTIAIQEIDTTLLRWLQFHWQRIAFALAALITSTLAVTKAIE